MNERKKYIIAIYAALFSGLMPHLSLVAQDSNAFMEVDARLETPQIRIGEQTRLTIVLKLAQVDVSLQFPNIEGTAFEGFEVVQREKCDTSFIQPNEFVELRCSWLLTSFDSGTQVIPPLPIILSSQGMNDTTMTPPLLLEVSTVEINPEEDIRDIKDVVAIPLGFWEIAWKVIAILVIISALIGGYLLYVRWRKGAPLVPVFRKVQQPPHVVALDRFESLRRQKLWQQGRIKEFHSELTDILRVYIQDRFHIPAPEMVTHEIIQALGNNTETRDKVKDMENILQLADLVKFAREHPLPDEHERSMQLGVRFVKSTIPDIPSPSSTSSKDQQQIIPGQES